MSKDFISFSCNLVKIPGHFILCPRVQRLCPQNWCTFTVITLPKLVELGLGKNGPGKNGPEKTVRGIIGLVVESVKTVHSFR